jgi:hTAFII28-like protein conserved region
MSFPPRPRGRTGPATSKRGRKPRIATSQSLDSPHSTSPDVLSIPSPAQTATTSPAVATPIQWTQPVASTVTPTLPAVAAPVTPAVDAHVPVAGPSTATTVAATGAQRPLGAMEEEAEGEDELLPAMADDDYSAQLSWQSQSKDNLKCVLYSSLPSTILQISTIYRVLMDNFTPEQYERFEAYRRHALPKQAVRKVNDTFFQVLAHEHAPLTPIFEIGVLPPPPPSR